MQDGRRIFIFTLGAITIGINSLKFCIIDCCSSTIAKNVSATSKTVDNKIKDKKTKQDKDKNAKTIAPSELNNVSSSEKGIDWRKQSKEAVVLLSRNKYKEAEPILTKVLPLARAEDPDGIDLSICLLRYGFCLGGLEKNKESIRYLEESLKIAQKVPSSKRQKTTVFEILRTTAMIYIQLKKFDKAEEIVRKAIAYRIAYPETSSVDFFKGTYAILASCLENQNKQEEANLVQEVIKTI